MADKPANNVEPGKSDATRPQSPSSLSLLNRPDLSLSTDHSVPVQDLMQTMVKQQSDLLAAIANLSKPVDSSSCVSEGGDNPNQESPSVATLGAPHKDSADDAPGSYDLEVVSSTDDEQDSDLDTSLDVYHQLYNDDDSVSDNVNVKLAENVNLSFRKRLSRDNQTKFSEKFSRPANCANLRVPKVNPEVWEEANSMLRNKDLQLGKVQSLLVKAAIPVIDMAQRCLQKEKKSISVGQCTDALVMMASAVTELTQIRRDSLRPALPSQFRSRLCGSETQPSTDFVFGDELGKKLKEMKEAKNKIQPGAADRYRPYHGKDSRKGKFPSKKPFLGQHQRRFKGGRQK